MATQYWITSAASNAEAFKAILLARSLRNHALTTRPLGIILSTSVPMETVRLLQEEFKHLHFLDQQDNFNSAAKERALKITEDKFVFLDHGCLAMKNCDELFRLVGGGVQWEGNKAVLLVKPRNVCKDEVETLFGNIVRKEKGEKSIVMETDDINFCLPLDVRNQTPLPGEDIKMVCFKNGHPMQDWKVMLERGGVLEKEIVRLCVEVYPKGFDKELIKKVSPSPLTDTPLLTNLSSSIAIVGMSCRYPLANNIDEFWKLLDEGLCGTTSVPPTRWTRDTTFIRMDNIKATQGCFLSCPIDTFDAKFFNTNHADMHYLDPQQRLSLRVVWEGLEHAGVDPNGLNGSMTGVFGGWWRNDYKEMLQMLGISDQDFLRGYMGNALGPLTARISHFFNLIGPSFSTESGCSTSIAGVDMACASLRSDECNLAIAVGANLLLHPFSPSMMEGVLAPDGKCKTFDAGANGFGRAEGIAVLILKRFPDAVADGDRIWGVLRGEAIVQEGTSKSMGTPTVDVEARAMELALERAGVDPDDVEFVEMHGTGTPVGDPIEVAAVARAYSGKRGRKNVLTIGSVKTNIGHTESVCGIAGIQKSILAMHHEVIPKHLHLNKLNPEIDLASIPARIPTEPIPWKKGSKPRIAGINSFGITGAQAHVLVQEPPTDLPTRLPFYDERELKMLTFSAKSEEAFRAQVENYKGLLQTDVDLDNLEYTMHVGRPHMNLRAAVFGRSKEELLKNMENIRPKPVPNISQPLCFMFTGQGSQYLGMAKTLYDDSVVFRSNFEHCHAILTREHNMDLKKAMWEDEKILKRTLYSQTSIFVVELCLLRLWTSWGLRPDAVMGHSLGEFAAAVAAGMLDERDALKLVVTRSKLIDQLPASSMLVISLNADTTTETLEKAFLKQKKWLDIAATNSPDQTVLAGPTDVIKEFKLFCDNNDIRTHVLDASHAFHSRLMDGILDEYEKVAATIEYKDATSECIYISGVDGKVITRVDARYWVRHTREAVRWLEASHAAVREGYNFYLEVGPHPVLSTLLLASVDDVADVVTTASLRRKTDDWDTILSALATLHSQNFPVNFKNFHRYSNTKKIDLPGYHFEETPYWMTIKDEGSTPFHPLLGSYVPNPSDLTIFKSTINVQRLPFLRDHRLGDRIIFPCVGYVDMCMTAGYAATHCGEGGFTKPSQPLCVRNFNIVTPVCLSEMYGTEFQVVVSKTPETTATIYTKVYLDDGSYKWVRNATATFNTTPPAAPDPSFLNLDSIRARCTQPHNTKLLKYKQLEDFGFNFGPSCQTLKPGYRNPEDEEEWYCKFECKENQEDLERFIIHPWVTDPMLQAQIIALGLLHEEQLRKRLVVPVQIDNFTWWGHSAPTGYVYIRNSVEGHSAYLMDEDGRLMVSMIGTEFMDTTLSNILSLIDSQKNPYPTMNECNWREKLGPEDRRVTLDQLNSIDLDFNNETPVEEQEVSKNLNNLARLYLLRAFAELDLGMWREFQYPEIAERLGTPKHLQKLLLYVLNEVVKDGWIEKTKSGFKVSTKHIVDLGSIKGKITNVLGKIEKTHVQSLTTVGENLCSVLRGRQDIVGADLNPFYTKARYEMSLDDMLLSKLTSGKTVLRLLDVGGNAATHLIPLMTKIGVSHFSYTGSPNVEDLFEGSGISARFQDFNVNVDPLDQGFVPEQYDVVFSSWWLSLVAENVNESLRHLKTLIRPGGYFILTEAVKGSSALELLLCSKANWEFKDNLRDGVFTLNIPQWEQALKTQGFNVIKSLDTCGSAVIIAQSSDVPIPRVIKEKQDTWILFGNDKVTLELGKKLQRANFNVIEVTGLEAQLEEQVRVILRTAIADESLNLKGLIYGFGLDQDLSPSTICEPFLYICKHLARAQGSLKIVALTSGNLSTGANDYSLTVPSASPLIGMVNVLANENQDLSCKCIDIDPTSNAQQASSEAFVELFNLDDDVMVVYRKSLRCTARLRPYKVKTAPLPIPQAQRIKLVIAPSHLISDLRFEPAEPEPIGVNEVEVEVKAYALNFLDVLMVTKPDPIFEKYNYVGVDIAGIITAVGPNSIRKVGDRVVCTRRSGQGMPSHVVLPDNRTLPFPDEITYAEASTYPMGILTVGTCLVHVAKAKAGDVVLIHTASGGVGLIGIQIAERLGCTVVVTAGNDRKRNYLRNRGCKYVFDSRTTEYEHEIRKALGGRGVTVVLNSLTGPGFKEATLRLCDEGARFVEMSKMNIWTKEEVAKIRSDVFYDVVDVSKLDHDTMNALFYFIQGQILAHPEDRPMPTPYVRYDASEVREALELMEKVKHIGKIVVMMPEGWKNGEPVFELFNSRSTYLITGGLGGIGLEVAKWMVQNGARNMLLLSRSAPKPDALDKIEKIKSLGARVTVKQCDVSNYNNLNQVVMEVIKDFGFPLRGIMHAAGLLDDATYENQTWEKYENAWGSKVKGAWNLHELSLHLECPLEHFVVFSSITATLGAVGQSNYAAANQYLDSLVHYRYSIGLPGTTINWGQWGQVGMAANHVIAMNRPLTTHQGLAALEHALKTHKSQLIAHEADLGALKKVLASTKGLLADIEQDSSTNSNEIDGDEFWREYDGGSSREEKYEVVRKFLKRLLRITLKMDKNEEIEDNVNFQDMGMDSLMMVEMKNGLQASVGKRVKISINAVKDCKTVAQLSDRLVELISGIEELPAPSEEELKILVAKDCQYPIHAHEVTESLKQTLSPIEQVETVLVIGSTGMLGPYVVRELSNRPHIKKIYCLMQSNPLMTAPDRFRKIYEKKGLFKDINMSKIECILGDVKELLLGMTESVYNRISQDVEAIFNLAVKVSFEEVYRETEDPKSSRIINVHGMKNVLMFAADTKLKHVLHCSTFAAETMVDSEGHFWESWPKEEEVEFFPNSAYSISKLICDRLCEQGVERGVPVKVLRLPQIGGDAERGGNIQMNSFLMMRMLAYLYMGHMHHTSVPLSLMAVDECARLSVELFLHPEAKYEVYNLLNPHLGDERDFESLARDFGVSIKVMDSNEFLEKFKQIETDDEMMQLVRFCTSKDSELLHLKDKEMPFYTSWRNGKKDVFYSKKVAKLIPELYPGKITHSWEILRRDLKFARDSGVFERYGIKHGNAYLMNS